MLLNTTKTVASLCGAFTAQLENIQKVQVAASEKLQEEINNKRDLLNISLSEQDGAIKAIRNIRKLFGVTE